MTSVEGRKLESRDLEALAARWIDAGTAHEQFIRRVASIEAAAILGCNGRPGDYSGILIPWVWPGDDRVREYQVRRDRPEVENGKPVRKYSFPAGSRNMLYFPVGTEPAELADTSRLLVITEGAFKAIALRRAACCSGSGQPLFLATALSGVDNWRGRKGKAPAANGGYVDEVGSIPDLDRLHWDGRRILILFDRDLEAKKPVWWARKRLTQDLKQRGARVSWFEWPDEARDAKGVDDLLAAIGPERVLECIDASLDNDAGVPNLLRFYHNDSGNAERLVALHGSRLRYCHAFKRWLVWDGRRWAVDETGHARKLAKQTQLAFLSQAVAEGNEAAEKFAKASLDARPLSAMLSLAEPEIFITPADLDTNPWALNFQNGTLDLRTATLRLHQRTDFLTKILPYDYGAEAQCAAWKKFLARIMGGGPDAGEVELDRADRFMAYLQMALGYSLTASTQEKAVFVLFGSGSNGKTTLLAVFRQLLGSYAGLMQVETLMVRQETSNTLADLADLRGLRFVQTSETEEGQRLAQGKLKRITQGMGTIKACRKYENPIEFPESHKLWVDTNRRPTIQDVDDPAIFSRLHLIPFLVEIPQEERNPRLTELLLAEAEGILAWAVEGARLWYRDKLGKLPEVEDAGRQWRDDMDQVQRFIDERCVIRADAEVQASTVYSAYQSWAAGNGERSMTGTKFGRRLNRRGYRKVHTSSGWFYLGIGLLMTGC